MAPVRNARVLFVASPATMPEIGKHMVYDESGTIDLDSVNLKGGILIKTMYLSIDPYLRECMRERKEGVMNFAPMFELNTPMVNCGIGHVLKSEHPLHKKGEYVYGLLPFQEYTVLSSDDIQGQTEQLSVFRTVKKIANMPLSVYIGVVGMPGQTAYYGWKEFADPQKGDVAFITTAAGPVGATVAQLAKMDGCKVIASSGSDEKVRWTKSYGADVAFNYKTTNTQEILRKEGPINIYWDNVGGEVLGTAFAEADVGAKFIHCGFISGYNSGYEPVKNVEYIFIKSLKCYGIVCHRLQRKYVDEFYRVVPELVASGKIKYKEDRKYGLEKAMEGMVDVLTGKNTGKSVIVVAEN